VVIKWVALLLIVAVVAGLADVRAAIASAGHASLPSLAFLIILALISRILYAIRWQIVCAQGLGLIGVSTTYLLRTNLLAEFVGIAMPSSLGGEAVRLLKVTARTDGGMRVVTSIVADRLIGVVTMALLVAVLLPEVETPIAWQLPEWAGAVIGCTLLVAVALATAWFWLRWRSGRLLLPSTLQSIELRAGWLASSILLTMAGHLTYALGHYPFIREMEPIPVVTVVAMLLVSQLARSVPVSLLGIGLSEGSMIAIGTLVGMRPETALAAAVISLFSRYFFAVTGVLVEMAWDGRKLLEFLMRRDDSRQET
jgi:uncharacterized membrane protein YbhN (UPF0104 family)